MRCPRCESAELHELDREGLTVDRCDRCRGVWLDRGELEKLLARAQDDLGAPAPRVSEAPHQPAEPQRGWDDRDRGEWRGSRERRWDDDDDDDDHHRDPRRRRGLFHTLRELID